MLVLILFIPCMTQFEWYFAYSSSPSFVFIFSYCKSQHLSLHQQNYNVFHQSR